MKVHLIISVGTSIISNYEHESRTTITPSYACNVVKNTALELHNFPEPTGFSVIADIIAALSCQRYWGAEQSSVEKTKSKLNNDKADGESYEYIYHLLSTGDPEALFCSSYLGHNVFNDGSDVKIYIPEGLEDIGENAGRFSQIGLPNLLTILADILNQVKKEEGETAIIIPTGGYKALIPYLTIASILYDYPAYYIYEKSENLIELPTPPLSVNTETFRAAFVIMENICGSTENEAQPHYKALPAGFQKLLYLKDYKYAYTAFGKRLKDMYLETSRSPLMVHAGKNSLVEKLGKWKETFQKISGLGETVWLGDKAPEMADHAGFHHINLFTYCELLLLLILDNKPDFLSEDELFLLLSVLYFHYCGHTRSFLETNGDRIPLLPTEIRTYHNILGEQRLKSDAFQEAMSRQGLKIAKEVYAAIADLAVYHRKKMPLRKGIYEAAGLTYSPLRQKSLHLSYATNNYVTIDGKRLELLAALFRIIDGMDKQVNRAGEAVEVAMKAESVLEGLDPLLDDVKRLAKGLSGDIIKIADDYFNSYIKDSIEHVGAGEAPLHQDCNGWETTCNFVHKPEKPENPHFISLRTTLTSSVALSAAWEYLKARTRLYFQMMQPLFYYSDLLLGPPKVSVEDDSSFILSIEYKETSENDYKGRISAVWNQVKTWANANLNGKHGLDEKVLEVINGKSLDSTAKIMCDIRDEYCRKKNTEVARILKDNGITIQFKLNGAPVSCCVAK